MALLQGLSFQTQNLCRNHLGVEINQEKQTDQIDPQLGVEKNRDCEQWGRIGGRTTVIGLKNSNSFLIGTQRKGLILMEDGAEAFVGNLPVKYGSLLGIIYYLPLKCYLLAHDDRVYKKDLNSRPVYLFINIQCGKRAGGCSRYSNLQQRLDVNRDEENIALSNNKTRKLEIKFKKGVGNSIGDVRVFGKEQKPVVW